MIDVIAQHHELSGALLNAAAQLRQQGDFTFLNNDPEIFTTFQLAAVLEDYAQSLKTGSETDWRRLWCIFAVASTWDDAAGGSHVGQHIFDRIDALYRPA